jgi:hypothetical protein
MKFTYSSGQRPLEGYTIKRGIGRGGFGEVYYGLSDGGKEVALKLVCSNLEVELRGMSQCLNLKHPNLVNLYDLRSDSQGDHWVVMEYIAGEPLGVVLTRHPEGLQAELAKQWFLGMAAAVGYLHDHGIVHRDLKPGNIFLENGAVKIGDYGLCKFIGGSHRTAQTQSVGTVHYMAPEISTGNYNKQIDIYAAGIILYEMLTGHVPFEGESAGEILMKHLTSPPDLSKVPFEYVPIISKALCKNPAQRYRSIADMARDVTAVGVVEPAPASSRHGAAVPPPPPKPSVQTVDVPVALPAPQLSVRERVLELSSSLVMATVLAALFTVLWAALLRSNDVKESGICFFLTLTASWAVLVPAKCWTTRADDSWGRRVVLLCLGLTIGVLALWLDGYQFPEVLTARAEDAAAAGGLEDGAVAPAPAHWLAPMFRSSHGFPVAACYLSYFGLAFFVLRWWKMTDRRRSQRFSLFAVLAVGFWAYVLLFLWPWPVAPHGVVALVMASVIVQLASPWEQPPPSRARRVRLRYA